MSTVNTTPIPFQNDLDYDVIVYDSFTVDNPDDAENNYFGQMTLLTTITAKSSGSVVPIRNASVFVCESATGYKPVKRATKTALQKVTTYTIAQSDEDAMTTTLKFIDFLTSNPNDPVTTAFYALFKSTSTTLASDVNTFFTQHSAYSAGTFTTYMMGITYKALHPDCVSKKPEQAVYSLSLLVTYLGGKWPAGFPDIAVTNFNCCFQNNVLELTVDVDLTTLPFESGEVQSDVLSMMSTTKVTVGVMINFAIGLNILGTRLSLQFDDFKIPVSSSDKISVTKPMATLDISPLFKFVVFTLKGAIPATIFNTPVNVDLSLTIDNDEAAIGAMLEGNNTSLPAPPGVKGPTL